MVLCLLNPINAQESKKFMVEAGVGGSFLFGHSNLSPWGIDYRKNYNKGQVLYGGMRYIFDDNTYMGVKVNLFSTTGNYEISGLGKVAENIYTYYVAPQVGSTIKLCEKLSLSGGIGAGYMYYLSEGLLSGKEFKIDSHFLAFNIDASLDYFIKENLSIGLNNSLMTHASGKKINTEIAGVSEKVTLNKWNRIDVSPYSISLSIKVYL